MTTVDHPLLEANRAIESGFLDPDVLGRISDEWHARPHTPASIREAIFETLGSGWRGCVPLAFEEVCPPDFIEGIFGVARWVGVGVLDDSSVLALADGSWFGTRVPDGDADREMAGVVLSEEDARDLEAMLAEGRKPVWAIPATHLLPLGGEREYRAYMSGERDDEIPNDEEDRR